jgi:hypothetical protein
LVPGVPPPRPLRQHNCSSPYQCFKDYCYVDLPGLHPPKVVEATQHPLEGRQHHSLGLSQERRGDLQFASPGSRGEGSGPGSPDVHPHSPGLHSHKGKHPGRRSVSLPRDSRLAASSLSVSGDLGKMGSLQNRPLCQQRLQTDSMLLQLGCVRHPRSCTRTLSEVGLLPRIHFSSDSSPQESSEETGNLRGTFILVSPLWEAQTWLASLLTLKVWEVRRLPFMDNLVTDLMTGKPPPILHNLHLVAWRISGGSTPSRTSLVAPEISARQGGASPQRTATKEPGSFSKDIFIPLAFHSIKLV